MQGKPNRSNEHRSRAKNADAALRFQPIFDRQTGKLYAFEAQTASPSTSAAQGPGMGAPPSWARLQPAIERFASVAAQAQVRLLWPIDLAGPALPPNALEQTQALLARTGLTPNRLILELATQPAALRLEPTLAFVDALDQLGYLLACGVHASCELRLRLLHEHRPVLTRIDPFLTQGLERAPKKRLLLSHWVRLLQSLGIKAWVPGVETDAALRICQDIGCDLVAGGALASAATDPTQVQASCRQLAEARKRRRREDTGAELVSGQVEHLPTLPIDAPMQQVFDRFREHVEHSFFPIVNRNGRPLGLLQERDIKRFTYSSYGRELLSNRALKKSLVDFLTPCPTVDIGAPAERVLEVYAASDQPPGVIVTRDGVYDGFLSQAALLDIIERQKLATAREQNPLTGLPGNRQILEYIGDSLETADCDRALVYFDFDHFKPFNDRYGFRYGDRVIQLFGELLRQGLPASASFAGHIGGDDFFAGLRAMDEDEVNQRIAQLLKDFARNVESLHEPEDRARGYIEAPSRAGTETQRVPLLRCSAAVLLIPAGVGERDQVEAITRRMAMLKKTAKASPEGLATLRLAAS